MKLTDLKKGFWGYKKEIVFQYIAYLNEEFSQKMLDKESKDNALIQELQEKNKVLESEVAALQKEIEAYAKQRFAVSDSIIDAQNYATQLKAETLKQEQAMRTQINDQISEKRRQMEFFIEELEAFREHLKSVLKGMDSTLQQAQKQAEQYARQDVDNVYDSKKSFRNETNNNKILNGAGEARVNDAHSISNMSVFQRKTSK